MSNSDRLQGGMKHAPGVLCLISGIPRHLPAAVDNKKTVVLQQSLGSGGEFQCGHCGMPRLLRAKYGNWWKVKGTELLICMSCGTGTTGQVTAMPQQYLIPLGDSSLIEGEKWEATNPKEDKLERASVMVAQFRKAYPALHNFWKDQQS